MLVVVNPYATSVNRKMRDLVLAALASRYSVEVADTTAPGDARELAAAAVADGSEVVAALGGDGTLNEVATALAGSGMPLYPLPGGSQNVFAKLLGLPSEIVDSTARLLDLAERWPLRRVDLGRVNGRVFTFAAGVGLDASVVAKVDANPGRKARLKQWSYVEQGISVFLRSYALRKPRILVECGGAEVAATTVLVQNGENFTFAGTRPVTLCSNVALDSGSFAAALVKSGAPLRAGVTALRIVGATAKSGGKNGTTQLGPLTALALRSADEQPLPLQVDGDFAGEHLAVDFSIEPGALTVLAPPARRQE
jgi:diacylglycerol kinase family enzyme